MRTSESRPDWVPSLPRGPAVLTRPVRSLRPPLAPSSRGQALSPRRAFHLPELSITRRHRGFTRVHPPGLPPRLLTLGWDRAPWACSPGFAPRQAGPARRTPGQGTGIKHSPGVIRPASAPDLLPLSSLTMCDLVSHDRPRHDPVPHRRPPGVLGQDAPRARQSGQAAASRRHRQGQRLARRHPRRGRRRRRPHQDLPGVRLQADRPAPRQANAPGRGRPVDPHHRLAPALRPRRPLHRPRPRLARPPRPATPQTSAHRRTRTAIRQESHPPRHRLTKLPVTAPGPA